MLCVSVFLLSIHTDRKKIRNTKQKKKKNVYINVDFEQRKRKEALFLIDYFFCFTDHFIGIFLFRSILMRKINRFEHTNPDDSYVHFAAIMRYREKKKTMFMYHFEDDFGLEFCLMRDEFFFIALAACSLARYVYDSYYFVVMYTPIAELWHQSDDDWKSSHIVWGQENILRIQFDIENKVMIVFPIARRKKQNYLLNLGVEHVSATRDPSCMVA